MAEKEQLKATRKGKKSAVTREVNSAERYMAEKKDDEVTSRYEKIKSTFAGFEASHEEYHLLLTVENEIDDSDDYFYEVQKCYVNSLKAIDAYFESRAGTKDAEKKAEVNKKITESSNTDLSRNELLGVLNMPQVQLDTFEGDPLQFHSFFAVFDERVDKVAVDGRTKLTRLLQCTGGRAKEAIKCCSLLDGEQGYTEARQILKNRYGSDHLISDKVIKGLKHGQPVKSAKDLQQLSDDIANGYSILSRLKRVSEVDTQSSIIEIVDRLQPYIRNRWKRNVFEHKRKKGEYPNFKNFVDFLSEVAEEVNDPVYGEANKSVQDSKKCSTRSSAVSTYSTDTRAHQRPPCVLCAVDHKLRHCTKFRALKIADRLKLVKDNKLCENCLLGNHSTANCRNDHVCSVHGCGRKHSNFLHVTQSERLLNVSNANTTVNSEQAVNVNQADAVVRRDVYMPLVSVKVNNALRATALLDSGSNSTFCTRELVRNLGLVGRRISYNLNTLCNQNENVNSEVVSFSVSSNDGRERLYFTNVYVVDTISVRPLPVVKQKCEHLKGLSFCDSRGVQILIGQDQSEALVPLEVRRGAQNEPFAIRTLFGWALNGRAYISNSVSRNVISHFVSTRTSRFVSGTKELLSRGGFRPTKFVLNDRELLCSIPEDDRAVEVGLVNDDSACSKALGIKWDVNDDQFFFDVNLSVDSHVPLTRRRMLSLVSSIFDPLGLVSPITIRGKLILQEATRCKLAWDESVPEELCIRWHRWVESLFDLRDLKIPRCIKPVEFNDAALELHHFSDASQDAYGCASYLRSINKLGQINVELIIGKSKVAPVKSMTIPRLELQGAVLAAKIDATLRQELDLNLATSWFWTDSEIVLCYISNESRRFQVFVGNRVSAIQSLTKPEQWRFIPGVQNPADLLTRGESVRSIDAQKWFGGPKFLNSHKSTWQSRAIDGNLPSDDPEIRSRSCFAVNAEAHPDPIEELFKRHSNWYSLKRAVAWILRFGRYLQSKGTEGVSCKLTVLEVQNAEISILRYVHEKNYAREVRSLAAGKGVLKTSSLSSLDPILDENGVIRVGGRLKHARSSYVCVSPYFVPHDHPIAKLIAFDYHNVAHCGTEWVVSEIRKRFWITRARSVVKCVSNACMFCKRMFANVCSQKMADLPSERLESGNRPFTFTGIDCFGPFLVKQGRAEVKRYGCLFTCLNTRAVHLEKLNSLETDSFLNAFRRFVARRGCPKKVWSDNGTNLTGGCAEILKNLRQLDQKAIYDFSVKESFVWHFNPPTASHMGGAWERLIRTVRKVLVGMLKQDCRLSDESLETLFCEIEFVVNGRPITRVGDSVLDSSPLTPNHLLLLSGCPTLSPGVFHESDLYKRRWRQVQHLANVFWKRWVQEYLPELQVRAKWHHAKSNLKEGDFVLILGENTPRGLWPMGLIVEIYKSDDGLVRSAKVQTKCSKLVRPVTKLVLLEGSM